MRRLTARTFAADAQRRSMQTVFPHSHSFYPALKYNIIVMNCSEVVEITYKFPEEYGF